MSKKIKLEYFKGKIALWKYNKKGFYNFVELLDSIDLAQLKRRYKGYELTDKTGNLQLQVL